MFGDTQFKSQAREGLKFRTPSGEIVDDVELVAVRDGHAVATYGNVRPSAVASKFGIDHSEAD